MGSVKSSFKVMPVGQGLFYTGEIKYKNKKFTMVYDCGYNNDNKNHGRNIVNSERCYLSDTIDLVILSHFHMDHVQGFAKLLEGKKVNNLVIPYLIDTKTRNIMNNIISFLATENEISIENLFYYNSSLADDKETEPGLFFDDSELEENLFQDQDIKGEEFRIIWNVNLFSTPNYNNWGNVNNRIHLINNSKKQYNFVVLKLRNKLIPVWKFTFFNLPQDQNFVRYLQSQLNNVLENLRENYNKNDLKKVEKIYKKAVKKSNLTKSDWNNEISICMYHEPLSSNIKYRKNDIFNIVRSCKNLELKKASTSVINKKSYHEENTTNFIRFTYTDNDTNNSNIPLGTLLLGDFNLRNGHDKRLDKIKDWFSDSLSRIEFFHLPHHGSKRNWDQKILNNTKAELTFFTSFGINNTYKHPSFKLLDEISTRENFILGIHEFMGFEYTFKNSNI